MSETDKSGVMDLTVTLLSAYFANNTVPSSELPALVEGTRRALLGDVPAAPRMSADEPSSRTHGQEVESVAPDAPAAAPEYKPAVSIEESLASPDQILSLIDGKPYKALKRHLSAHGLTPVAYRARYGLPADYPLVAPSYSAARREVAQKSGLGGRRKAASAAAVEEAPAVPVAETAKPVDVAATPVKPAPSRRARTKPVTAEPEPVAKASKSTAPKSAKASKSTKTARAAKAPKAAAAAAPAISADAAPKPRRRRTPQAAAGTAAPTARAPEAAAPAK